MTEPRALHTVSAIGILRFKRTANKIGQLANSAQMQLQRFAIFLKLLLEATEKWLQSLLRRGFCKACSFLDCFVDVVKPTPFA